MLSNGRPNRWWRHWVRVMSLLGKKRATAFRRVRGQAGNVASIGESGRCPRAARCGANPVGSPSRTNPPLFASTRPGEPRIRSGHTSWLNVSSSFFSKAIDRVTSRADGIPGLSRPARLRQMVSVARSRWEIVSPKIRFIFPKLLLPASVRHTGACQSQGARGTYRKAPKVG